MEFIVEEKNIKKEVKEGQYQLPFLEGICKHYLF
jgi:hypothetical protein